MKKLLEKVAEIAVTSLAVLMLIVVGSVMVYRNTFVLPLVFTLLEQPQQTHERGEGDDYRGADDPYP